VLGEVLNKFNKANDLAGFVLGEREQDLGRKVLPTLADLFAFVGEPPGREENVDGLLEIARLQESARKRVSIFCSPTISSGA
jgi:hypothetical protein